ncbi:MAG: type II toxin-antitoxin system VapC family toxin [Gammaproteobacteria bacterium]
MIVADTGALVALIDADDQHHEFVRNFFERDPDAWLVPWAVLPEVDYLISAHVGDEAAYALMTDLCEGIYLIDWGVPSDLERARDLNHRYRSLRLGLVDAVVIAVAERLKAEAIVTLDLRDFGAVDIRGRPKLLPRDAS